MDEQKGEVAAAPAETTESGSKWWYSLLWAAFFFAVTGFLYWYLTDFERVGGRRKIHALVAMLYNLGGKWTVVGVFGGIGLIFVVVAVRGALKKR